MGNDRTAKDVLKTWPVRPGKIWTSPGREATWMRALPKPEGDWATGPYLGPPSAKAYRTRPDGMWLSTDQGDMADVFCVEHCSSMQNLNDKRSRYSVFASSVLVFCTSDWFSVDIRTRGGGWSPRWKMLGMHSCPNRDQAIPVRYLRVLYSIPDNAYEMWRRNSAPAAHEFFCRHSSFGSYNSQKMQGFLWLMSPSNQFYTKK